MNPMFEKHRFGIHAIRFLSVICMHAGVQVASPVCERSHSVPAIQI